MEDPFGSCYQFGRCAMFDLRKFALKSEPWACELRIDLYPPFLNTSKVDPLMEKLCKHYKIWCTEISVAGPPAMWETNLRELSLYEGMVTRITVWKMFIFPQKNCKFSFQANSVLKTRTDIRSTYPFSVYNIQYFIVDLIRINGLTLFPGGNQYVYLQQSNVLETK